MKRFFLLLLVVVLHATAVRADESFVVSDIRVEGLQRISAASVFAALPINVGDTVNPKMLRDAMRALFRTGNFDDMSASRDGNILVISVKERPSISKINISGNKAIKTDALKKGLSKAGLAEGRVFKRSTLEGMQMELTRQYVSQGRYDAHIDTDVKSLPRNRVEINININEGTPAAIKRINIVGNSVFSEDDLRDLFQLKSSGWFSWLTNDDKYSKEKLSGDLDTLKSYYLDRGYIKFVIESTQVSVTPDRDAVYITVNIDEGAKYTVGKVDLSGDIILTEKALSPFIRVHKGETFSQARVTKTEDLIKKRLGNDGYNFAKVEDIPQIDDKTKVVNIKFFIDPGKRTYVRRISFKGNTRTADEVLRREMRQMESAPASSAAIDTSKVRLERLGYFKNTKVDTVDVPGSDDLIDLVYSVEEQPSGSIGASVGYSQDSGLLFGASIQQDNFMGSGDSIGISLNKSDYLTNIRFNYLNPYFTKDGVSRGFSVFYRKADLKQINISRYTTDTLGGNLSFGYPISETKRLGFSLGYSKTTITAGIGAVQEISSSPRPYDTSSNGYYTTYFESTQLSNGYYTGPEILHPVTADKFYSPEQLGVTQQGFIDKYGDSFNNFSVTMTWSQSTLNSGRLATRGTAQSASLELTTPGSDLEYYKLVYDGQIFVPMTQNWTLRFKTELGYGDGFGGNQLPFFDNFFAGGFGSVRGYRSNTLGPRSTPAYFYPTTGAALAVVEATGICKGIPVGGTCPDGEVVGAEVIASPYPSYILNPLTQKLLVNQYEVQGDPFGGNILVQGSAELLFPLPFVKDQNSVRSAFFIDSGNVFSQYCRPSQENCYNLNLSQLRYSFGVGLTWITGFGPLTFSYAKPFHETKYDKTEAFQFSLGRSF